MELEAFEGQVCMKAETRGLEMEISNDALDVWKIL